MEYLRELSQSARNVVVLERNTYGGLDVNAGDIPAIKTRFLLKVAKELKASRKFPVEKLRATGNFRVSLNGAVDFMALRNALTRTLRAEGFTVKHK